MSCETTPLLNPNLGRIEIIAVGQTMLPEPLIIFPDIPDGYARSREFTPSEDESAQFGFVQSFLRENPVTLKNPYKYRLDIQYNNPSYEEFSALEAIQLQSQSQFELRRCDGFITVRDYVQPLPQDYNPMIPEDSYTEYKMAFVTLGSDGTTVYRKNLKQGIDISLVEWDWRDLPLNPGFLDFNGIRVYPTSVQRTTIKKQPNGVENDFLETSNSLDIPVKVPYKYSFSIRVAHHPLGDGLFDITRVYQQLEILRHNNNADAATINWEAIRMGVHLDPDSDDEQEFYLGRLSNVQLSGKVIQRKQTAVLNLTFVERQWRGFDCDDRLPEIPVLPLDPGVC